MGTINVDLVVRTNITSTGTITNADYAVRSDQVALVRGEPVTTRLKEINALELDKFASANMVIPGDLITYTLTITHSVGVSPTGNVVLTDTIPVGATFVIASSPYTQSGDIIRWDIPSLDAMGSVSVELVVRVDIDSRGTLTNEEYAVHSDQVALVRGSPVNTLIGKIFFLPITMRSP
jgi:uncharacterized repeat protein (TIGR01451 family)